MHPDLSSLQQEAQGLLVISETEAALEAFELAPGEGPEAGLRRLGGHPENAPVEIQDAATFIKKQERMYADAPQAARFQALGKQLQSLLTDLRLYRIGSIQVDAFLLGRLPGGNYGGLRTRLVET